MTVFKREIRRNFRSWAIWTASIVGYLALIMSVFPSMVAQGKDLSKFFEAFPKAMLSAFSLDKLNFADVLGFYATEGTILLLLASSIYAIQLASGILAKEESDKTIEFLLAKPITRTSLVTQKTAAALIYVVALNVVQAIAAYITVELVKSGPYSAKALWMLSLGGLLINLTFAAVGLLISVFVTKIKSLYPLGLGLVLGAYMLNVTAKLTEKLDVLKWFSPFSYADTADLVTKQSITPVHWVLFAVLIVGSVAATYVFYNRKDITV
ncbi:MAG TPA: ABC transporter permease subunit [Bacillota bacterium]|jgi:ABC-2 type transport system permease protein